MSSVVEEGQAESLTLGQQLKTAREQAKLSLADIERTLHVAMSTLQSIENDSIDQSINPLFTKGYIKSYAGLLGLDKEYVLSLYAQQYSDDVSVKKMQTFSNRTKLKEHNSYLNYVSWIIVLLLGATTVGWWYQQETTGESRPASTQSPSSNDEQLNLLQDPALPIDSEDKQSSVPVTQALFTFSQDCWIKVTDASNDIIAIGIKKQGTSLTLSGIAPFEVSLGAPNAVAITYLGNQLDITPYINGQTARFSVPLEK